MNIIKYSLENYDEVYRACAYFAFKYGKIDWLESNNEYWLLRDARSVQILILQQD